MKLAIRLIAVAALAATGSLLSGTALAQETTENSRWYVGGAVGFNQIGDTKNVAQTPGTPATPGPICGLIDPLLSLPQELCNLLGGSSGVAGTNAGVTTSFSPGVAISGTVGYKWDAHWRPEVSLSYLSGDVKSISAPGGNIGAATGSASSLNVMANAWYDFMDPSSQWRPYAGLGLGFNNVSEKGVGVPGGTFADGSSMVLAYQVGAGVSYKLSEQIALSADYRYLTGSSADIDNPSAAGAGTSIKFKDHAIYGGLRYSLGKTKSALPEAPQQKVCVFPVEGVAAEFIGADGCPLDSDGDGKPDYMDECPHSPPGAKVLPNGCALEGDCRRPKPGEEVDAKGCAVDERFVLRGVKFEFDSDRLLPESKVVLDGVAETLKTYPKTRVQVEGHTDNIGETAYNLGLSERRAIAVRNYLTGRGADGANLSPVGYGEAKPAATNDTEEGREENRRVEFAVVR